MIRGEVWTVSGGSGYAGKPRPCVIVRSNRFSDFAAVTYCPFTSFEAGYQELRPEIAPSSTNGLRAASFLMVDKITSLAFEKLGKRIGRLDDADLARVDRALLLYLDLLA